MTRQVINKGTTGNDGTGDTLRLAADKINDNFGELYNYLGIDSDFLSTSLEFQDSAIVFLDGGLRNTLKTTSLTDNRTILLPNASDTLVGKATTDTLTNKTLTSPVLTTPQINDTSANHQYVFAVSELAADRTVTLPLLTSADTFVFQAHSQTLTNKTLTNPILTAPNIVTSIDDTNGAELIKITATASAVNEITIANAATGNKPSITATGDDTNIGLNIQPKASGAVSISKPAFEATTYTAASNTITNTTAAGTYIANRSTGIDIALNNGSLAGELKHFININTGLATVTPVSFKTPKGAYTSFTLDQWASTTTTWTGSYWVLTGNQDSDLGVHII